MNGIYVNKYSEANFLIHFRVGGTKSKPHQPILLKSKVANQFLISMLYNA